MEHYTGVCVSGDEREIIRLLFPFQEEAIHHYADATQCHGGTCEHGVEQKSIDGKQYTGSDGNSYDVVNKSPKQILFDSRYRLC